MQIRKWSPSQESIGLLRVIADILIQYSGMRITLRQLYYQLVVQNAVRNEESRYKRVASIVTKARYAGIIPWDAIEDRMRRPYLPSEFRDVDHLVEVACSAYELDYWQDQPVRPEVWIEKEALANVMEQAVGGWHTSIVVNRGYASASSLYDNAKRIAAYIDKGQKVVILYLGDHDPSGMDMVRDVRERIAEFLAHLLPGIYEGDKDLPLLEEEDIKVVQIALTDEQIQQYDPPPNPTKLSDSRAYQYIRRYGKTCWELDALPPQVLHDLVVKHITDIVGDEEGFASVREREQAEIVALRNFVKEGD